MPRKIGFTVVSSSSHEENFSAQELMVHAPTVSGWRSSRYNGEYLTTIDTLFLPIKSILSIIKMLLRELPVKFKTTELSYYSKIFPTLTQ